jgi:BCD family chlorophyll transporter-like MFS transporter
MSTQSIESIQSAPAEVQDDLSLARNIKIGTFHIGSSMADILLGGVWNRVAIAELGFGAFPISLLLALRYFLAPLSVWVGQRSDASPIFGYRRTPYIWLGRLMILISLVAIGFATVAAYETASPIAWIVMIASVILFSVGSAFSGTTYLALIYDLAPPRQKTRVVSVVWFFLISGFAISGVLYSVLLRSYTREGFLQLFVIAPIVMGAFWLLSVIGEERRVKTAPAEAPQPKPEMRPFWPAMREAWSNQQSRIFFWFLGLTTLFFYTQDGILEPFAAQVFEMPTSTTNRFSSYWGSMTLIGIVVCLFLARRFPGRINNTSLSRWSVVILGVTFALFTLCAFAQIRALVTICLIILGVGLGAWTVGTLGLMMDMTLITGAGLYLSLWTVSETLARGVGTLIGGAIRDVVLALTQGNFAASYGAVFLFQAVGFLLTLLLLNRVNVRAFQATAPSPTMVIEAAMD